MNEAFKYSSNNCTSVGASLIYPLKGSRHDITESLLNDWVGSIPPLIIETNCPPLSLVISAIPIYLYNGMPPSLLINLYASLKTLSSLKSNKIFVSLDTLLAISLLILRKIRIRSSVSAVISTPSLNLLTNSLIGTPLPDKLVVYIMRSYVLANSLTRLTFIDIF